MLLEISVIPILFSFIYLVVLNRKQPAQIIVQLKSSLWRMIVKKKLTLIIPKGLFRIYEFQDIIFDLKSLKNQKSIVVKVSYF